MTPTATLDPRYSSDTAAPATWEQAELRLQSAEVAWLVSVRPDGRPHATPVVPVQLNGEVYFHTSAAEQKYANLQTNQNVLILAGDSDWNDGLDVAVEGVTRPVTDQAVLAKVAELYAERWDGRWRLEARDGRLVDVDTGGSSLLFEVKPAKAFGFAKGDPFSQTTYRF
jgi:general stress protein 26